mmetsp:Transcript_146172/g.207212  ORF Transcript_146172/g.207212 Transcript_146172/m.207212 type:complete len:163 (+) Transcript_146172:97-585(+)
MGRTHGIRRGTRYMFAVDYKKHGPTPLQKYFVNYKVGDIVDIKTTGAQQKGMAHKAYHGKTGRIFNVSRRAVGIVVNKRIKNRILAKRINVRIEHIKHSTSRAGHLARAKVNDELKAAASKNNERVGDKIKRQPAGPREGHFVSSKNNQPEDVAPIAFDFLI